jgi:CRISPR type IV-associated protein Csf2
MSQYNITGTLKLTAPLHVAAPGDRTIDLGSLRLSHGEGSSGAMPITGTTHYPMALSESEALDEGQDNRKSPSERGLVYLPVFPANDARGRLRRLAAEEIFTLLKSRGEFLSMEAYHGMTCGAVTGQLNKELTFDVALKSGRHAFLGLFGGGPRMITSNLVVNTFWPVTSATVRAGLVPAYYEDEKTLIPPNRLTRAIFYRRIDDAMAFSNGNTELVVKEYSSAVAAWIKEISASKSEGGQRERSKKQLHTFAAIEYVIPGTRFFMSLKVNTERPGLGALGLLIHSLTAFANKQRLGGWTRNGFGSFDSDLDLIGPDNARVPLFTKTDGSYEPNVDAEKVAEALDAWATVSANITAAELEDLYSLPAEKKTFAK